MQPDSPDRRPPEKLITAKELSEKLNVSMRTLRDMVKDGSIPFIRVRGQYRFVYDDVVEKLANN